MVVRKSSPDVYAFNQLNEDLNEFYKYLKENKFSDEEIQKIFEPLISKLKKTDLFKYILLIITFLGIFILLCTYSDTISWHASAVGRILLIKLLPYWNWQTLKNEHCLIKNFGTSNSLSENDLIFNCDICETIDSIDAHTDLDPHILKIRYLDMDIPVILTNSLHGWPQGSELLSNISSNKHIKSSLPCSLGSNLANGILSVGKLLRNTELFDSFFMHFQNCEIQAVKNFRALAPRPKCLHPELAPVQFNWLMWSKDYNVSNYKMLELVDRFAIIGQIEGVNFFKLIPRNNCEDACKVLHVRLAKEEALIVTSLWNVEYKPNENGENIAVILEIH